MAHMTDKALSHEDGGWDDLRFPAHGVNPPGAASDPDRDSATGLLLFDFNKTETIAGVAQMPHTWQEGSDIYPHVHWQKTTSASGNVMWQFEYEIVSIDGLFANTYSNVITESSSLSNVPDTDEAGRCIVTSFGAIDMDGFEISSLLFWKVSRLGLDAADTYGTDARLVEFDIHYLSTQHAAVDRYQKTLTSS